MANLYHLTERWSHEFSDPDVRYHRPHDDDRESEIEHVEHHHGQLMDHYRHSFSREHISAITKYSEGSADLNHLLLGQSTGHMYDHDRANHLQHAQVLTDALKQTKTPHDMHVYSGVGFSPKELHGGGHEGVIKAHLPAFTSTSLDPHVALGFAKRTDGEPEDRDDVHGTRHLIKIHVPQGSHGGYIAGHSDLEEENEFLMPKGAKLHIHPEPTEHVSPSNEINFKKGQKFHVWHAKLVHDGHQPTRHASESIHEKWEHKFSGADKLGNASDKEHENNSVKLHSTLSKHYKFSGKDKQHVAEYSDESEGMNHHLINHPAAKEMHPGERDLHQKSADALHEVLGKHSAPHDMHVYSGVGFSPARYGKAGQKGPIKVKLDAFTSTSTQPEVAQSFSKQDHKHDGAAAAMMGERPPRHLIKIHVPQGSHGAYIAHHSEIDAEHEYLIPKGAKLHIHPEPTVDHIEDKPGRQGTGGTFHVWHAKLVHDGHAPTSHAPAPKAKAPTKEKTLEPA